jgi:cytoskeletal protein CcmA (bactofilin family)
MARDRSRNGASPESVISIIGPGMRVIGDCETDGTIRIEGTVEGGVRAGKAVVVSKEGVVTGDIVTQDAVVSGTVIGTLVAESRLELQVTCLVEGDIRTRRMQIEEGAILNGTVHMGEDRGQGTEASSGAEMGVADGSRNKQTFPQPVGSTQG